MIITDSHCHIHNADFPVDPSTVQSNAKVAQVERMICVGTDTETSLQAIKFVADKPNHWAAIGIHPHDAKLGQAAFDQLRGLLRSNLDNKVVAIGECGLDYFYGHSTPAQQEAAFRSQIELAVSNDLPLIFHVREAYEDFWRIIADYPQARGVLHSYTDNLENLQRAIEREFYIGQNGIITFTKNSWELDVARAIPDALLLVETDAPFLTPVPLRGKVNEPANVRLVVEFLAKLRGTSLEKVAKLTTDNAAKLFRL